MNSSLEFNQRILRKITENLIEASNPQELIAIRLEKESGINLEKFEEKKEKENIPVAIKKILPPKLSPQKVIPQNNLKPKVQRKLFIPEIRLPPHLQYLRPEPVPQENQIDLGKINSLIDNLGVREVECNGPDTEIVSRMKNGTENNSGVSLTKEEIDQIINTFSQESKIPAEEGLFRVVVGNLQISAIISELAGSKFIIKKIFAMR